MPWKTPYGTHYHMIEGCHNAHIPCETKGLTPCADCCGGISMTVGSGGSGGGLSRPLSEDGIVAGGRPLPEEAGTAGRYDIREVGGRKPRREEPRYKRPHRPERPEGWITDLVESEAYSFLRDNPHLGPNVDSLFLGGSNAYGLELDGSDVDIRGFAMRTGSDILVGRDFETVVNQETDTTVYSFDKFVTLLGQCNPNIIEFLGLPDDAYERMGPAGRTLHGQRAAFLSQRAAKTFGGYAMSQLNRLENAIGRNAQTEEAKTRMERRSLAKALASFNDEYESVRAGRASVRLSSANRDGDPRVLIDVDMHSIDVREFNQMLGQTQAVARSYDRLNARNRKKDPYHLAKHMCHLLRLYRMGSEILRGDGVITNREDAGDADFLMEVKLGRYLSEDGTRILPEFFDIVDEEGRKFDEATRRTRLPEEQNHDRINKIRERENLRVIGRQYF